MSSAVPEMKSSHRLRFVLVVASATLAVAIPPSLVTADKQQGYLEQLSPASIRNLLAQESLASAEQLLVATPAPVYRAGSDFPEALLPDEVVAEANEEVVDQLVRVAGGDPTVQAVISQLRLPQDPVPEPQQAPPLQPVPPDDIHAEPSPVLDPLLRMSRGKLADMITEAVWRGQRAAEGVSDGVDARNAATADVRKKPAVISAIDANAATEDYNREQPLPTGIKDVGRDGAQPSDTDRLSQQPESAELYPGWSAAMLPPDLFRRRLSYEDVQQQLNALSNEQLFSLLRQLEDLDGPAATNSKAIPTLLPSGAAAWNRAVQQLQAQMAALNIPVSDHYNYSLPEIPTVGNLAGLGDINALAGSNLGASAGATTGNVVSGAVNMWGNYVNSFLSAMTPGVDDVLDILDLIARRRQLQGLAANQTAPNVSPTASTVACAMNNTVFRSSLTISLNNVASLAACQTVCQLYSSPLALSGCYDFSVSATEIVGMPCLAVSFGEHNGRCSMFFSIEDEFTLPGFTSAPVVCPGVTAFAQTAADALHLQQPASSKCEAFDMKTVIAVDDSLKPPLPSVVAPPALKPLPAYSKEEEASISKYNPEFPMGFRSQVAYDVIYQVGFGVSNPPQGTFWGSGHNASDWRVCALWCQHQEKCKYWTYFFNPQTYAKDKGGCALATSQEPRGQAVNSVRTIAAPRLNAFPVDLFGDNAVNETAAIGRRLAATADIKQRQWVSNEPTPAWPSAYLPSVIDYRRLSDVEQSADENDGQPTRASGHVPCREQGVVYYSVHDNDPNVRQPDVVSPTLNSLIASDADTCAKACAASSACLAWQFIPPDVLNVHHRLQQIQTIPCVLLASATHKYAVHPIAEAGLDIGDPSALCEPSDFPPELLALAVPLEEAASAVTATPAAGAFKPTTKEMPRLPVGDDGNPHLFANGVSIRGRLLSGGANVIRETPSPDECHTKCQEEANCAGWTWGKWQGCYIMETIDSFIGDQADIVVSGYKNWEDNQQLEKVAVAARKLQASEPRGLSSCARATRGRVFSEGSMLANQTEFATSDECWRHCRQTLNCFYITFVESNATGTNSPWCLTFDQASASEAVGSSAASILAEVNCDVLGELVFKPLLWTTRAAKSISLPAAITASLGVVCVVAGFAVGGIKVKTGREECRRLQVDHEDNGGLGQTTIRDENGVKVTRESKEGIFRQFISSIINRPANGHTTSEQRKRRASKDGHVAATFLTELTPSNDTDAGDSTKALTSKKRNAFGMNQSNVLSPGTLERAQIDDFETVEPKSTAKRLRKFF